MLLDFFSLIVRNFQFDFLFGSKIGQFVTSEGQFNIINSNVIIGANYSNITTEYFGFNRSNVSG